MNFKPQLGHKFDSFLNIITAFFYTVSAKETVINIPNIDQTLSFNLEYTGFINFVNNLGAEEIPFGKQVYW